MALTQSIIDLIRDEIGPDQDWVDNTADKTGLPGELGALEDVYNDPNRGGGNILKTALICWRRRLHALQARSFDASTEGALMNRSQRIRFIERRIKTLENLVDTTYRATNSKVLSTYEQANLDGTAEL